MSSPIPIIMFPGLAANHTLFHHQQQAFSNLIYRSGCPKSLVTPLKSYAQRLAEHITSYLPTNPEEPYILGGLSFGCQIAQAMVAHLHHKPKHLLLICGMRGRHQYSPLFTIQELFTRPIPASWLKHFYTRYAGLFAATNHLDDVETQRLLAMANDIDADFSKWSVIVCAQWSGKVATGDIPITHIHGELDTVIPDSRHQATHTLAKTHHLITMTHPAEVNPIIQQCVDGVAAAGKHDV